MGADRPKDSDSGAVGVGSTCAPPRADAPRPAPDSWPETGRVLADAGLGLAPWLLGVALLASTITFAFVFSSGLVFHNLVGAFAAVLLGGGYAMLRAGRTAGALRLVIWGLWGLVCVWGLVIAGIRTPVLVALPLLVTLCGWLLPRRETVLMFLGSAAVLSAFAWGEHMGWLEIRVRRDLWAYWTVQVSILGFAAVVALSLNRSFLGYYRRVEELGRQLHYRARYDSLTGLPNRASMLEYLEAALSRAARGDHQVAVMFIDLDEFKAINDRFGHAAGDRVLADVADRLREVVRTTDAVARLGGDEFLAVLADLPDGQAVLLAVERILASLDLPIQLEGGQEVRTNASIGIALSPGDGAEADTLLRHADTAMYESKARGRRTFSFYAPEMTREAQYRQRVTGLLRGALARDEFRLWLQPRVDMAGGGLVGAEALLRWDSPELGLRSPQEFLGLAEKAGCMAGIGDWVMQRACALWRELADQGLTLDRLAINVSAGQLLREGFLLGLETAMTEHRVPAGVLQVEVSEAGLLSLAEPLQSLAGLRRLGVGVALDDFGAGLSSLQRLAAMPLDVIKIDRSFASQIGITSDGALVTRIVIGLAETLGLQVVAEGVEHESQSRFLMDCGCHVGQGYHFGKPMSATDFFNSWRPVTPPEPVPPATLVSAD